MESSLFRGTPEPRIENSEARGRTQREGPKDSLQQRLPQMLTEAVICSTLGTGQRQQQLCVSHLPDVHTRHVDEKRTDGWSRHTTLPRVPLHIVMT